MDVLPAFENGRNGSQAGYTEAKSCMADCFLQWMYLGCTIRSGGVEVGEAGVEAISSLWDQNHEG